LVQNTPDDLFLGAILKGLGEIARFQGNFDQATAHYGEALANPQWDEEKAMSYCLLADVERLRDQIEEARQHLLAGLQCIKSEADWSISAPYIIPYFSYFAVDQRKARQAASLFGWIEYWNKTKGFAQRPVYQAEIDHYHAQARKQLSDSEFNSAWAEGQSMNQVQVLALAMEVLQ
jgi:hypothetical protein